MMKEFFDDMAQGIEAKLAQDPESKSPRKVYALEVAKLGSRLYSGENRVAWCGLLAPFDLLSAMGITSCFVEFIGALLASTGQAGDFLEEAEESGFTGDICGYHRAINGAMQKGVMPEPDFCIGTNLPCTGGLAVMENLARYYNKDLFVLNIPQQATKSGVKYLADQIRQMVQFISDKTKEPLDEDKLKNTIQNTNQMRELMQETFDLAKSVPSPVNSKTLANFAFIMSLLMGTDEGVEVARTFRDDFAQKVAQGVSGSENEKLRLLWVQNRIQFQNSLVEMLEKEFGAVIVIDELNDITWDPIDPENPYEGIARRMISIPFIGKVQQRIERLQTLAGDYKVHGAINPCHWGCRQGTGARGLIGQGFQDIGVPSLNLEVDCIDQRNFAEGQLKTRLEAFMEVLENRPSPWA